MTKDNMPKLGPWKAVLPIGIGLAFVGWTLQGALAENGGWSALKLAMTAPGWPLALAAVISLVFLRDLGYVLRLRWLSGGELAWRQAIETTVVWEFASAVTPGIVGGGGVAIWALHCQGMTAGRSTAVVFSTTLLDQLFYALAVPAFLVVYGTVIRPEALGNAFGWGVFWASWGLMLFLAAIIAFGLLLAPAATHRLLCGMASVRWLRRWQPNILGYAEDLKESAVQMQRLPWTQWTGAVLATLMSWSARFLTLVAVMGMVVAPLQSLDALLIVARQLVMWVFLLVSPTPGSSGVAEWLLDVFFAPWLDASPSPLAPAMTMLIWRLATHFVYLLVGVLVIPGWLRRNRGRKAAGSSEL
ncbi:MAG: UPF0104 family protein [Crocinitomicaceae bacterium TMED114]|nr:MAG: UPF0104 family protein [Crocinitomicaceae bacterium TMED114]